MMKKALILILCLAVTITSSYSQSKQDGFVKEYNNSKKKKPIVGAEVLVRNAGRCVTGKEGDFSLEFRTLKPGDQIQVQEIIKSGYEIFNLEQLNVWRISNNNDPFTIVMCKSSMFKNLKDHYNAIAYKSYQIQQEKEEISLKNLLNQGKIQQEDYEKKMRDLCQFYEEKLDNLHTYIDRFARIDLEAISKEESKIIELVNKGEIQKAIDEYNAMRLDDLIVSNYRDYMKLDSSATELSKASQRKQRHEEELLASLNNKYNLIMMQGNKKQIDNILTEFEGVAEKCPKSLSVIKGFVDFAHSVYDYNSVYNWGPKTLTLLPDAPLLKNLYCRRIADAAQILDDYITYEEYKKQAEQWINKAMVQNPSSAIEALIGIKISEMLYSMTEEGGLDKIQEKSIVNFVDSVYSSTPTENMLITYHRAKNQIYLILTDYYLRLGEINKAMECSRSSIVYIDSLKQLFPDKRTERAQIDTYHSAGYLNMLIGNYDDAEAYLLKSKYLLQNSHYRDPYSYYAQIIGNYSYLSILYYYKGEYEKSRSVYDEAVPYILQILESRPYGIFFTSFAEIINNQGYINYIIKDYNTAEECYNKAIQTAKPFVSRNPYRYLDALCTPQINLGTLLLKQNKIEEFAKLQDSYWANVNKVVEWQGSHYHQSFAIAYDNKGYYELLQGNISQALEDWQTILKLDSQYHINHPESLLLNALKESKLIEL